MDFEYVVEGFAVAHLARVCKETGVSVPGFSKKMALAPRPLLIAALVKAFGQAGPKQERVLLGLGRIWAEQNPEEMATLRREVASLQGGSEAVISGWLVALGQRWGRRKASQAMILGLAMVEGVTANLVDPTLLHQAMEQWPPEEAEPVPGPEPFQPLESVPAEPAPAKMDQASLQKEGRKAAQVKELQQTVKRLKGEVLGLERRLQAAQSREASLVDSLAQVRAALVAHQAAAELPEPRERTRRLVKALFELLRERELLQGEVQRLRDEVATAAE